MIFKTIRQKSNLSINFRYQLTVLICILLSLYSVQAQRPERYVETGINHQGRSVAFSPDGKLLAAGGLDRLIKIWDVDSGRELLTLPTNVMSYQLAFDPTNQMILASLTEMNSIELWDISTQKRIENLKISNSYATTIAFSSEGKNLLFADPLEKVIRGWETKNWGELTTKSFSSNNKLRSLKFSQDGKLLAAIEEATGASIIYDIEREGVPKLVTDKLKLTSFSLDGGFLLISFSPDNKSLLEVHSAEGRIRKWNLNSGLSDFVVQLDSLKYAQAIVHSPKEDLIAVMISGGSEDGTILILETKGWTIQRKLRGYNNRIENAGILPDTNILAVQLWYDTKKFIDLESGNLVEVNPQFLSDEGWKNNQKTVIFGR